MLCDQAVSVHNSGAFLENYAKSKVCQLCMGVKLGLTKLGRSV